MKKLLAVLAIAFAVPCHAYDVIAEIDKADPQAKVWSGNVTWIRTNDVSRVCSALNPARRLGHYLNARGCWREIDGMHYLVSRHEKSNDDLSTAGHELKHAADGYFHDSYGRWRSEEEMHSMKR